MITLRSQYYCEFTFLTDVSVLHTAVSISPTITLQLPTFKLIRFFTIPAPPAHGRAVGPEPRGTARLAIVSADTLTCAVTSRAPQTDVGSANTS